MSEQGSAEWLAERLGKVTASRFVELLPESRTKSPWSKTAQSYMLDLLAERLTRLPQGFGGNRATEWGNTHEAAAIRVYEARTRLTCTQVGFVNHATEKHIGGSPDRLVGDDGGVEAKCPFDTRVHLEYYLGGVVPKEHVAQVQGHLWNSGRKWWDFISYDPRIQDSKLALFCVRAERDEEYIEMLSAKVCAFRDALLEAEEKLIERLNA
ncbi:MAG TPA: YqaJ viral recombinase family protein [Thermoguttaceae bacterium]|nr:YqaJ viral recombinase family protein [Thermoguttaceae bacterium]